MSRVLTEDQVATAWLMEKIGLHELSETLDYLEKVESVGTVIVPPGGGVPRGTLSILAKVLLFLGRLWKGYDQTTEVRLGETRDRARLYEEYILEGRVLLEITESSRIQAKLISMRDEKDRLFMTVDQGGEWSNPSSTLIARCRKLFQNPFEKYLRPLSQKAPRASVRVLDGGSIRRRMPGGVRP